MSPEDTEDEELFTIDAHICWGCLNAVGHMCHTPGCVFIRRLSFRLDGETLKEIIEGQGYEIRKSKEGK